MNYTEITSNRDFIEINGYLIKVDAIDAIHVCDIEYEYKEDIFYIYLYLKGRERSLEFKYDSKTKRNNDYEKLIKEITIV